MTMERYLLAVACGMLAVHGPAVAAASPPPAAEEIDPRVFQWCDGYGSPNEYGDGMTEQAAGFLGIFRPAATAGDMTMAKTRFSTLGAGNCDAALASTRLRPDHHLRRASLLRARAIHKLAGKDTAGALADLDAADAEGRLSHEPLYERSMGVGNSLMRAYALIQDGRRAEAVALSRAVQTARPYAYSVRMAAGLVALAASNDGGEFYNQLDAMANLHPPARRQLFELAMDLGQFDKAIAMRRLIDLTPPPEWSDGYSLSDYPGVLFRLFAEGFVLDGKLAFALAARGRDGEAAALLARMESELDAVAQPLPNRADGTKPPRLERDTHLRKQAMAGPLRQELGRDKALVGLLPLARAGDKDRFLAAIKAQPAGSLPADGRMFYLLQTLRGKLPIGEDKELVPLMQSVRQRLDKSLAVGELPLSSLYEAMPGAETRNRLPKYKSARNILGENTGNGFTIRTDGAVTTVNFGGVLATSAMVGEMALLKAADLTLAAGKDRMAVLTQRITARTLRQVGLYGGGQTSEGYVAVVRFVPFGAEGLPAGYGDFADAWVSARAIRDALMPVYSLAPGATPEPAAAGPASKGVQ